MLVFYSGLGRWYYDDFFSYEKPVKIALGGLVRETGRFELGDINKSEIESDKKTTVYYLKSYENEQGVTVPFSMDIGELDIPYFEPETPFEITDEKIIKDNEKVLIKKSRDTNELLLLIYEMFDKYGLRPGIDDDSKLPAVKAWGLIVSGKFESEYIVAVEGIRSTVRVKLNGGEEIEWGDFKRTYNLRFKKKMKSILNR